jgi:hypothetical protein
LQQCFCRQLAFGNLDAPRFVGFAKVCRSFTDYIVTTENLLLVLVFDSLCSFFQEVLLVCDEADLIGREMFAIDGCKLPFNVSKEWSGTTKEFQKKAVKLEKAIGRIVTRHRKTDSVKPSAKLIRNKEEQYFETVDKQLKKICTWLGENEDRSGSRNVKENPLGTRNLNLMIVSLPRSDTYPVWIGLVCEGKRRSMPVVAVLCGL